MNANRLIYLGAELLLQFRESGLPADRAAHHFFTGRRYLGSRDRRFLSDAFYHLLRHLRRIDHKLLDALSEASGAQSQIEIGFPVDDPEAAKRWQCSPLESYKPTPLQYHWIDVARIACAAIELNPQSIEELLEGLFTAPEQATNLSQEALNISDEGLKNRIQNLLIESGRKQEVSESVGLALQYSWPDWLWAKLCEGRTEAEAKSIAAAMEQQAPTTLRMNTAKCSVRHAEKELQKIGMSFTRGRWSPTAIVLRQRAGSGQLPLQNGWYEFQDEASQLASLYASPLPGTRVIDACAGGGGKSLHLAEIMGNHGRLISTDISEGRLQQLEKRAHQAGATIVEAKRPRDDTPPEKDSADLVFIDAPCSGTGTLRRNPDLRWRLSPGRLNELCAIQMGLLNQWAGAVRPGGFLVFATCSVLHQENRDQVEPFLSSHPGFQRAGSTSSLRSIKVPGSEKYLSDHLINKEGDLVLVPQIHGCDGFYASRLQRVS